MRDPSKPIESYLKLSKEIDALPYEFPLCVLENFQEFVWQKLMEVSFFFVSSKQEIFAITTMTDVNPIMSNATSPPIIFLFPRLC
jgi:hypothetical protein